MTAFSLLSKIPCPGVLIIRLKIPPVSDRRLFKVLQFLVTKPPSCPSVILKIRNFI